MLHALWLVLGLVALTCGGDALVGGAVRIAQRARISKNVIGLTIVAAGTSMPEFVVSLSSALSGNTDIAVGNVVGSNIFNTTAILGCAALIHPLSVQKSTLRKDLPMMLLGSVGLLALAWDGRVARWEGGALLGLLVIYLVHAVRGERAGTEPSGAHQQDSTDPQRTACCVPGACGTS